MIDPMHLKRFFAELPDFTKRELLAIYTMVGLGILLHLSNFWLSTIQKSTPKYEAIIPEPFEYAQSNFEGSSPANFSKNIFSSSSKKELYKENLHAPLFAFDPNTASYEQLTRLGISIKTAQNIENYRNKGGRIRKANDFSKIYGLSSELFERLRPYISIQENAKYDSNSYEKFPEPAWIDINSANKSEWQRLNGIGQHFAQKIVLYRNKLGGFIRIEQVKEVYGLPDSTFQLILPKLKLTTPKVRKININTATPNELLSHPYLAKWQVEDIIKNRPIYGEADLLELYTFKKEKYRRVLPYLEY